MRRPYRCDTSDRKARVPSGPLLAPLSPLPKRVVSSVEIPETRLLNLPTKRNQITFINSNLRYFTSESSLTETGLEKLALAMLHQGGTDLSPTTVWYLREYGPLLSSSQAAKLLGYRNSEALRQARIGHRLPVPMFRISNRRGWFAATEVVARWIEATVQLGAEP